MSSCASVHKGVVPHGCTEGDTHPQLVHPFCSKTHPHDVDPPFPSPTEHRHSTHLPRVDRANRTTLLSGVRECPVCPLCSVCPLERLALALVFPETSLESQLLKEGWRRGRQRERWACLQPKRCSALLPSGRWSLSSLTESCQGWGCAEGLGSGVRGTPLLFGCLPPAISLKLGLPTLACLPVHLPARQPARQPASPPASGARGGLGVLAPPLLPPNFPLQTSE